MGRLLAYGSLMWDNALATFEGEKVGVPGMRRAFVGQSTRRWGSAEAPCPLIGLVPGEGCEGVLFRVPRRGRRLLYRNLGKREARPARRLRVVDGEGRALRARAYLPAPGEREWPEEEEVLDALSGSRGLVGTGVEYIRTLIHAMELWGVRDPLVERVWDRVRDRTPAGAAGGR